MVFFNYSTMQMAAKVVYYGPGLCGKTTNLQWIFEHTSTESRGEMVSLATETDRTLFFDLLPIDVGSIAGFSTRIQLYTVPGQVFYNTTRKLVLKGVDGVVFVADSQRPMLQANIESFQNLEENLAEMGLSLDNIPVVLQYNKRDLPAICSHEELDQALNRQGWPAIEASALNGDGVFETLKMISKATLLALKKRLTKSRPEGAGSGGKRPVPPVARPPVSPRAPQVRKPPTAAKAPPAPTPSSRSSPMPEPTAAPEVKAAPEPVATVEAEAAPEPEAAPEVAPEPTSPDTEMDLEPPALEAASPAVEAEEAPAESPAVEADDAAAAQSSLEDAGQASAPPEEATPPPSEETAPEDAAAKPVEPEVAIPAAAPAATTSSTGQAPAARPRRKKKAARAGGFDALAELEKLRRQAIDPGAAATSKNGKREINRDVRMTLNRADFSRAHRVALTLQIEDVDAQVVDEARHLHVDIDDADSLEELLVRLNIELNAST